MRKTNSENNSTDTGNVLRMSVRDMVSYAYRHGGLSDRNKYFDSQEDPGKIHSDHICDLVKTSASECLPECSLKIYRQFGQVSFDVRGRADLIIRSGENRITVIEIKTILDPAQTIPKEADILHLAQARIYAHMFAQEPDNDIDQAEIIVRYIHVSDFSIKDFKENLTKLQLEDFFADTCKIIKEFTESHSSYIKMRNLSIDQLRFPYPSLRIGQKDLMNEVLSVIRTKGSLFAQAPTGIGKTISVLFPSIKALPHRYLDHIFYLTAKTSTQNFALSSLQDLRSNGLIIKSIRLTAKEKLCPVKDIYCDTDRCPYAKNYYSNSGRAVRELLKINNIDADILLEIAKKHAVCPFEIGLDISVFCDIIICDYNYIYDPRVFLSRFMSESSYRFAILVDEAHNLPSRANEMYSASLSLDEFEELDKFSVYFSDEFKKKAHALTEYFKNASTFLDSDMAEKSFDKKIPPKEIVNVDVVAASRKIPGELISLCEGFINSAKDLLDKLGDWKTKKSLLTVYFDVRFFIRTAAEFFNSNYVTILKRENNTTYILLRCLNASERTSSLDNGNNAIVYFSATMSPHEYYLKLFSAGFDDRYLRRKILASPFPPENLWIGAATGISTKYEKRPFTVEKVVEMIYAAITAKRGNFMVYSPSFAYQRMLISVFANMGKSVYPEFFNKIKVLEQKSKMSDKERSSFIDHFYNTRDRTLVGFSVLGGIFGEGIDLTGESLSGVILIGVGLPGKSFEQDILMDYFNESLGKGFDYAYKFPGFNRILQAAGRVIRTETDKGFVLLIDERYKREDYMHMFPEEWDLVYIDTPEQLAEELNGFF